MDFIMGSGGNPLKVGGVIVQTIFILMVNKFLPCQFATKHLLHYDTMLQPPNIRVSNLNHPISNASRIMKAFTTYRTITRIALATHCFFKSLYSQNIIPCRALTRFTLARIPESFSILSFCRCDRVATYSTRLRF